MLQALRANPSRRAVSRVQTLRTPIGGLNARDPLAKMPAGDAITLDNFFPDQNSVVLRRGYQTWATGLVSAVQTLATYHALNGSEKLFGFANNHIYDATSTGSVSSVYSTGITSNKWQTINFSNSGGLTLLAVNGQDKMLKYNGTSWGVNTITGSISTVTSVSNIWQHKERVWFCQSNTLDLWYLATQAISSTVTRFPLRGVFNKGGQVVAGGTLSFDAGAGIDDYLVAVTDNGEAVVYSGTNPASDFALIGVYEIGETVGPRCLTKVGGDLIVTTTRGAVPMSAMINNDRAKADAVSITAKIAPAFNAAAKNYKDNFGWQGFVYPSGPWAIFNVPLVAGTSQIQYVQNIITGAWCRFTNMNANCWCLLNDKLYFGGNGGVIYRADYTSLDIGDEVSGELKTAFDYCGSPGQNKLFTALQPLMLSPGTSEVTAGVDVDFSDDTPTSTFSEGLGTPGLWDLVLWDVASWAGDSVSLRKWLTVGGLGTCVAAHIQVSGSGGEVEVNDFNVLFQPASGSVF